MIVQDVLGRVQKATGKGKRFSCMPILFPYRRINKWFMTEGTAGRSVFTKSEIEFDNFSLEFCAGLFLGRFSPGTVQPLSLDAARLPRARITSTFGWSTTAIPARNLAFFKAAYEALAELISTHDFGRWEKDTAAFPPRKGPNRAWLIPFKVHPTRLNQF